MSDSNELFILDMAQTYADENNIVDVEDLFKKHPVSGNVKADADENVDVEKPKEDKSKKKEKKPWAPDASLLSGMSEMNAGPVVYSKEELKDPPPTELKSIADDNAIEDSHKTMDDMGRKAANIEEIKRKLGIKHLQIPEGEMHAQIYAAAGDVDHKRAQATLEIIFRQIIDQYPDYIREWFDPSKDPRNAESIKTKKNMTGDNIIELPKDVTDDVPLNHVTVVEDDITDDESDDVKVVINKSQLPSVTWTKDEIEKIRKSRTVELTIVEDVNLRYSNIEDADENAVDVVLSKYVRRVNDVIGALPASKYRATFTGLTYTEVIDLTNSQDMNNVDGERKKWTIAYDHIKNPSIGDFEDFNDFLQKTSFMDIEFILWKILCATSMENEIITIDCRGTFNGSPCNRTHDWIYHPLDLLQIDTINEAVLEEMKKTGESTSVEAIQSNYHESMLLTNNSVELPTSKFVVVFGHISAYDYLNNIYPEIYNLDQQENPMISQSLTYTTLTVIKYMLLPKENGGYMRVKGDKNLARVITSLDEIDWNTITSLVRLMINPYQFTYVLKDVICPQCKTKSNIPIQNMSQLLFLLARSLDSVQVVLKKT